MKTAPLRRARARHHAGFTLVEIMIVVLIIGVLMNIALPAFVHARDEGQARACSSNLKRISSAKEQYALVNNMGVGTAHTYVWADLNPFIRGNQPTCPTNISGQSTYNLNALGTPPTCPYGGPVGLLHTTTQ